MPDGASRLNPLPCTAKTFGISWPLLVAALALLSVLGNVRIDVLADPDTYWHLATGRWILEHGAVPTMDFFSHSMPGAPWMAHDWLSELIFISVYQMAGWAGLGVMVTLAFSGTLAYVMRFLLARMEPVHALLFTAFAAGMLMEHLLARPHVLAWPLLAVWVGSLVDAGEQRRDPPWQLLPLMMLWSNLHGSFMLGLALGAALALDAVLRYPSGQRNTAIWRWVGFICLSVTVAMVTPSGWHGLWYPIRLMNLTVAPNFIGEFLSPDFHQLQMMEVWLIVMLAIAGAGRMQLPWPRLLLVLGLTHLALKHQRHISILGLVTPFLFATPLAQQLRATAGSGPDAESLDRVFRALAAPARLAAVAVTALLATLLIVLAIRSERFAPARERAPEAALQAAWHAGATGPVLNAYNFGGYLIYQKVPVFIDGRADMYGDALLTRYIEAMNLSKTDSLTQLLKDYHITWTLLPPGTPALALLDQLPGWKRVHADAVAVVHVRELGTTATDK